MSGRFTWMLEPLRAYFRETLSAAADADETVIGAVVLTAGLAVVTPVVTLLIQATGFGIPFPTLAGVSIVGVIYVILASCRGVALRWSLAGVVVTGTFGANVPLASQAGVYPGTLGPSLWLVHIPLLVTAGLLIAHYGAVVGPLTKTDLGLLILVVWSVSSVVVGRAEGVNTALFFALFWGVNALFTFVVVKAAIFYCDIDSRSVVTALCIAALGHVFWGVTQFFNGNSFGLSTLGEGRRVWATPEVGLGPLGSAPVGAFVSGFTGGPLPLVCVLVLTGPPILARVIAWEGWSRTLTLVTVPFVVLVVRVSDKLSGIGGFVLGVATFVVLLVVLVVRTEVDAGAVLRDRVRPTGVAIVLASLALVGYPSSRSERQTTVSETVQSATETTDGASTVGQVQSMGELTIGGPDPTGIPTWLPIGIGADSTLGIRIQQYVAAVDLFGYAPLVGIGGGNFSRYAAIYAIPVPPGHPSPLALHNLYLALLVETGLPGILAFILATGTGLYYGARVIINVGNETSSGTGIVRTESKSDDGVKTELREETTTANNSHRVVTDRVLGVGTLAGLLGFLGVAFWDTVQIQITAVVPFWVVVGAIIGDYLRRDKRQTNATDRG